MNEVKQVIVFRKDLLKGDKSIRKGKFAAQVAHASLGSLMQSFTKEQIYRFSNLASEALHILYRRSVEFEPDSILDKWLNGIFTKIVVCVNNEQELLDLAKKLDETEIPHVLITDNGLTEFKGLPTTTCLGIGPYYSEEIDKFTGNLSLL